MKGDDKRMDQRINMIVLVQTRATYSNVLTTVILGAFGSYRADASTIISSKISLVASFTYRHRGRRFITSAKPAGMGWAASEVDGSGGSARNVVWISGRTTFLPYTYRL